jgi:hypothetical protein
MLTAMQLAQTTRPQQSSDLFRTGFSDLLSNSSGLVVKSDAQVAQDGAFEEDITVARARLMALLPGK